MGNSQICIISNPYLVSLDGLPHCDIITDELRKNSKKPTAVPQSVKQFRKETNLRKLTQIELTKIMNRNAQTKETKNYRQSDSLNATAELTKAELEKKKNAK